MAYLRGQLAGELATTNTSPGAMISANLAEAEVPSLLEKLGLINEDNTVHIACVNSPMNVTLSGPADSIKVVQGHLDQQGVFAKTVNTGVAYHSPVCITLVRNDQVSLFDFALIMWQEGLPSTNPHFLDDFDCINISGWFQ